MKIFFFLPIPVGRLLFRTNYCRWRRCRRWCRCWRQRLCWRRRKMLKIAFTCRNEFTSQVFLHVTSTSFQSSHLAFIKISSAMPECHIKLHHNDDWYLLATSSIFPCNTTGSGANLCPNRTIKIQVHGITRWWWLIRDTTGQSRFTRSGNDHHDHSCSRLARALKSTDDHHVPLLRLLAAAFPSDGRPLLHLMI